MNKLTPQLQKLLEGLKRYAFIICFIVFGGMYGYIIFTAGQQAQIEPSESSVNDKYKAASRPKLDEDTARKLKSLESSNIEVKSIFDEARKNPFSE